MKAERASERPHRHPLHETAFWLALALPAAAGCAAPSSTLRPAAANRSAATGASAEPQLEPALPTGAQAPSAEDPIELNRRRRCPGSLPAPEPALQLPPGPDLAHPTEAAALGLARRHLTAEIDGTRLFAPPPRRCSPR